MLIRRLGKVLPPWCLICVLFSDPQRLSYGLDLSMPSPYLSQTYWEWNYFVPFWSEPLISVSTGLEDLGLKVSKRLVDWWFEPGLDRRKRHLGLWLTDTVHEAKQAASQLPKHTPSMFVYVIFNGISQSVCIQYSSSTSVVSHQTWCEISIQQWCNRRCTGYIFKLVRCGFLTQV